MAFYGRSMGVLRENKQCKHSASRSPEDELLALGSVLPSLLPRYDASLYATPWGYLHTRQMIVKLTLYVHD